jgi:hypothetical protein
MRYVVFGARGSDAGYWYFDGKVWHHVGGWQIEQAREVSGLLSILQYAAQSKNPAVSETLTRAVTEVLQHQFGSQIKESGGGLVIIAGQ